MERYEIKELLEEESAIVDELDKHSGIDMNKVDSVIIFEDIEEFAEYELYDGWFADAFPHDITINGAPNPIQFVDLEAFGNALSQTWDESSYYITKYGEVVKVEW